MEKFETKMVKVRDYGELFVANARIDKLAVDRKTLKDQAEQHAVLPGASVTNAVTTTPNPVQLLMAVETEKSERMKRNHNVIISGLPQVHHKADDETFLDFCENHLTLKPKPHSCVRIGRVNDGPRKLKVTFDDDSVVDDLLSSSQLLRESSDFMTKQVYFNRDLTAMEARLAFEARQTRRSSQSRSTAGTCS